MTQREKDRFGEGVVGDELRPGAVSLIASV
jgi:hypothetical protein